MNATRHRPNKDFASAWFPVFYLPWRRLTEDFVWSRQRCSDPVFLPADERTTIQRQIWSIIPAGRRLITRNIHKQAWTIHDIRSYNIHIHIFRSTVCNSVSWKASLTSAQYVRSQDHRKGQTQWSKTRSFQAGDKNDSTENYTTWEHQFFTTQFLNRDAFTLHMMKIICGALNSCLESCKETIAFATQGLDHTTRTTWCNLQESRGMRSLWSPTSPSRKLTRNAKSRKNRSLKVFENSSLSEREPSDGALESCGDLCACASRTLGSTTWQRQITRVRVWSKPWVIAKSQRSHFLYTTTPRWWSPGQANCTWPPQPLVGLIHSSIASVSLTDTLYVLERVFLLWIVCKRRLCTCTKKERVLCIRVPPAIRRYTIARMITPLKVRNPIPWVYAG